MGPGRYVTFKSRRGSLRVLRLINRDCTVSGDTPNMSCCTSRMASSIRSILRSILTDLSGWVSPTGIAYSRRGAPRYSRGFLCRRPKIFLFCLFFCVSSLGSEATCNFTYSSRDSAAVLSTSLLDFK